MSADKDLQYAAVYRRVLTQLCEAAGGQIAVDIPMMHPGGTLMHRVELIDENTVRIHLRFDRETGAAH